MLAPFYLRTVLAAIEKGVYMKRSILFSLILLFSSSSFAEIVEVYRWKAFPGKAAQLLSDMQKAAQIHSSMGISVQINQLGIGSTQNIDYVMRFDDLEAWGQLKDINAASDEWSTFYSQVAANPGGELVESINGINTDESVMAGDFENGQVFSVFVWDPAPGRSQDLSQGFEVAAGIHESLGARVESYIEGFGGTDKMHYVMIYDSWSEMAAIQNRMSTSEEWIAFQNATSAATEPAANLVQTFTGQTVANFD